VGVCDRYRPGDEWAFDGNRCAAALFGDMSAVLAVLPHASAILQIIDDYIHIIDYYLRQDRLEGADDDRTGALG
jgi:hypothetical protein